MRTLLLPLIAANHFVAAQPAVLYSSMPESAAIYARSQGDPDEAGELIGLGTWTLPASALTEAGTAYWGPAAGSTYAGQFPEANWLLKETWAGEFRYRYYIVSSGSIRLKGEVVPGLTTTYSIPRSILFFPMYLHYESYAGYQIEGEAVVSDHYSYSSYGSLYLGNIVFSNVIQIYGDDGVTYWHADPLYPIVMLETVEWPFQWIALTQSGVGVADREWSASSFTPYPNPSSGLVHIHRDASESSYSVTNTLGAVVLSGTRLSDMIDLSSLPPGPYHVRLHGPSTVRTMLVVRND